LLQVDDDPAFTSVDYEILVTDTSHTATTALAQETAYFWRVTPDNVCGTGASSEVFSFTTRGLPPLLLVDDDDNAPNVQSAYTAALATLGIDYDVWDTGNSDDEPTSAELAGYDQVVWFTGDEFGGAAGPGAAGETALATYLDAGGCLFLSSQDYHFDRGLTSFMQTYLGIAAMSDDDGDYAAVTGEPTSIFNGIGPFALDYGAMGLTDFSDPVTPDGTALLALEGDNANGAAVQKPIGDPAPFHTVFFAFPWEALGTSSARESVMGAILNFCPSGPTAIFADGFESGDASAWSNSVP
jgi:hypothetical protein